jgi:hypothetical protein
VKDKSGLPALFLMFYEGQLSGPAATFLLRYFENDIFLSSEGPNVSVRTPWSLGLLAACVLLLGLASDSNAQRRGSPPGGGPLGGSIGSTASAPELNPATGAAAPALVTGGVFVIRGLRRR